MQGRPRESHEAKVLNLLSVIQQAIDDVSATAAKAHLIITNPPNLLISCFHLSQSATGFPFAHHVANGEWSPGHVSIRRQKEHILNLTDIYECFAYFSHAAFVFTHSILSGETRNHVMDIKGPGP